jgi:nucleoside 2-deoxyribosyltransferase
MKTLCISASLKFTDEIRNTIVELKKIGITGLFPNLDSELPKDTLTSEQAKWLTEEHFRAIDQADALYVLCPGGYIGKSVVLEIGYAISKKIPVFYSEKTGELVIDTLYTEIIPTNALQKFVSH